LQKVRTGVLLFLKKTKSMISWAANWLFSSRHKNLISGVPLIGLPSLGVPSHPSNFLACSGVTYDWFFRRGQGPQPNDLVAPDMQVVVKEMREKELTDLLDIIHECGECGFARPDLEPRIGVLTELLNVRLAVDDASANGIRVHEISPEVVPKTQQELIAELHNLQEPEVVPKTQQELIAELHNLQEPEGYLEYVTRVDELQAAIRATAELPEPSFFLQLWQAFSGFFW
jgi:hypothetical protein